MYFPNYPQSPTVWGHMPLPIFQSAVNECINNVQAPQALGYLGALAAASLAAQYLAVVRKPTGSVGPIALMLLSVARSGDRKSTVEDKFLESVRKFERQQRVQYEIKLALFDADHEIWSVRHSALKKNLQLQALRGELADEEAEAVRAHILIEPVRPRKVSFLYDDSTIPGLMKGMLDSPSAGLISSEGSGILGGPIFAEQAKLNTLWSGGPVTVDRASTESFVLDGTRLTTSLMVQPTKLQEFMAKKGESARGSGLLARMITYFAATNQGTRVIRNRAPGWTSCDRFSQRMTELLERNVAAMENPDFKPEILQFSPQASLEWEMFFNGVEQAILPGGIYAQAGDHASKLADNVGRVAAVLHLFEGFSGDIAVETLRCAILICSAASQDFLRYFVPRPQEFNEAEILDAWLTQRYRSKGLHEVPKTFILTHGPNSLRKATILDHVISVLAQSGKISTYKRNKTLYLNLIPQSQPG